MKEIVVISGKGGTGKTSITASFAYLCGERGVVADCDVDAANMHLLLEPDFDINEEFYSGEVAYINGDQCSGCGICAGICRFDAVFSADTIYAVDTLRCEGCGYCARVCPEKAIINKSRKAGHWYISNINTGSKMVHAALDIGAGNSGKLVAKVKNEAIRLAESESKDFVLVDGSPGLGCPVISSLSGADYAALVTEPSVTGFHDIKRVLQLVSKFRISAGCIINKADINPVLSQEITDYMNEKGVVILGTIPYNEIFSRAICMGETVAGYDKNGLGIVLSDIWKQIKTEVNKINDKR